ncbi:exodeoxyribonuclease VII large subunit [Nitrospina watsonii]|uniref:Exodeoxyribonuclease 7 large subunit n=1 Tax=Nitrospina watsonii TaxID=1323948 RepID=A0ABM9H9W4_9BACT|nr:exodeoxyribonuclease VII large subunit [Nitrospina watsonii]CAI2716913.1 Exodeoxyribonuclease 7 large subunit [Nitrospina watsonii]
MALISPDRSDAPLEDESGHVFTVGELTRTIRSLLEQAFEMVWVEGEISNYTVANSGHAYFSLKDDKAQVRCVFFRGNRMRVKFKPGDGDQVLVCGRLNVYEPRGEYQIVVDSLEPRGLGALQKAFEQLKEKLQKEGLFDEARKQPIPEFPWRVGIVTSPTGAAIRDIVNVIQRRNPKISALLYPVKVQGDGAAEEVAEAIRYMNTIEDLDVLIVGRGGGSIEDLWAFNEEVVARAIYASELPVISAVGHEIDFTIADFVADLRAPTPSAAAELAVPRLKDVMEDLSWLINSLIDGMDDEIGEYKDHLRRLIDRRFFREPQRILEGPAQRLDEISQRLLRGLDQWVVVQRHRAVSTVHRLMQASPQWDIKNGEDKRAGLEHRLIKQMASQSRWHRQRFEGVAKNLNALSPLSILDRGYSITTDTQSGKAVKASGEVKPGDKVEVRLSKGKLDCTVDGTNE